MNTATADTDFVLYVRSDAKKKRIAAKMTIQQLSKLSGLPVHIIRNAESMNNKNKHVARLHQEAIDKFLFDQHNSRATMTIDDSELLKQSTLDMIKQKLDNSSLEELLEIAKRL